jgi:glycosyltransferase involved in cell wall biosynthesis
MKILIITVVWNNATTIKDAMDSVLGQTSEIFRLHSGLWC